MDTKLILITVEDNSSIENNVATEYLFAGKNSFKIEQDIINGLIFCYEYISEVEFICYYIKRKLSELGYNIILLQTNNKEDYNIVKDNLIDENVDIKEIYINIDKNSIEHNFKLSDKLLRIHEDLLNEYHNESDCYSKYYDNRMFITQLAIDLIYPTPTMTKSSGRCIF